MYPARFAPVMSGSWLVEVAVAFLVTEVDDAVEVDDVTVVDDGAPGVIVPAVVVAMVAGPGVYLVTKGFDMVVVEALVAADEGDTVEGLALVRGIDAATGQAVAVGIKKTGATVGEEGVEQDARLGQVKDVVFFDSALMKLLVTEELLAYGQEEMVAIDLGVDAGHGDAVAHDGIEVDLNGGDRVVGCDIGHGMKQQAAGVEGDGAGLVLEELLLGSGLLLAVDDDGVLAHLTRALVDVDDLDEADEGTGGPGVVGGQLVEHAEGHGDDVVLLDGGEVVKGLLGIGVEGGEGGVVGIDEQGTVAKAGFRVGKLADGAAAHECCHGLGQGDDGYGCLFHVFVVVLSE